MIRAVLILIASSMGIIATAEDYREWKDTTGKFSVTARLVSSDSKSVVIERKDNGKEIAVAVEKLSKDDIAFIEKQSVEMLRTSVRPLLDQLWEGRKANETTVQSDARRNELDLKIRELIAGKPVVVFATVDNVLPVKYEPSSFMEAVLAAPHLDEKEKRASQTFLIYFDEESLEPWMPRSVSVFIGDLGKTLSIGDQLRIQGTTGRMKDAIGRFQLDLNGVSTTVSIQSVTRIEN